MATAKKKKTVTAAKRPVKSVAKKASQSAWTQQSAKLYQLPFAQGDAAGTAESMMRMGSDALQQWWSAAQSAATNPEALATEAKAKVAEMFNAIPGFKGLPDFGALPNFSNIPGFDAGAAQEKLASFTRDSAQQLNKAAGGAGKALNEAVELSRENAAAVVEVTNIAVALSKELGAELVTFANKSFAQNVDLSKQVLTCRTLNDMFDLSSRIMKTNLDSFFSESVKLSELLFQASTDVSEPLNERISESSERISKALAA